ncbi:MAG: hypothetical protein ACE5I7_19320 [Candidatus Binatia bacterium]
MKKKKGPDDELREEYDFASMEGGVRGKYAERLRGGANIVVLEDDVATAFPTDAAVNEALRAVLRAAAVVRRKEEPPNKPLQPTGSARR